MWKSKHDRRIHRSCIGRCVHFRVVLCREMRKWRRLDRWQRGSAGFRRMTLSLSIIGKVPKIQAHSRLTKYYRTSALLQKITSSCRTSNLNQRCQGQQTLSPNCQVSPEVLVSSPDKRHWYSWSMCWFWQGEDDEASCSSRFYHETGYVHSVLGITKKIGRLQVPDKVKMLSKKKPHRSATVAVLACDYNCNRRIKRPRYQSISIYCDH